MKSFILFNIFALIILWIYGLVQIIRFQSANKEFKKYLLNFDAKRLDWLSTINLFGLEFKGFNFLRWYKYLFIEPDVENEELFEKKRKIKRLVSSIVLFFVVFVLDVFSTHQLFLNFFKK